MPLDGPDLSPTGSSHVRPGTIVGYAAVLGVVVGSLIPLVTLRSFPGYIDAWLGFLLLVAPAYVLVTLILLSRLLAPVALTRAAVTSLALLTLGYALGLVVLWFLLLFAFGAAVLVWASLKANATRPNSP
jgi:hypothetical protein